MESSGLIQEVRALLVEGKKIQAIQVFRQGRQAPLVECKEAVDKIEAEMGLGPGVYSSPEVESLSPESQDRLAAQIGDGWDLARIRGLEPSAQLLDPANHPVLDVSETSSGKAVPVDVIIDFSYLCLARDSQDMNWWMGQFGPDGTSIHCWGRYGRDLSDAIAAL